jgi:hypothetical protein
MKLVKTYNPLKNIFTYIITILIAKILLNMILKNQYQVIPLLICIAILSFLDAYPHEHLHKYAGKLLYIESKIKIKSFPPTCTPLRPLNYRELIIFSLFPIFVSIGYFILSILFYLFSIIFLHELFLIMSVLSFGGLLADFGYIIAGFKFRKNGIYIDKGKFLEIYQE